MNSTERNFIQRQVKRARMQRNATTNNEDFDYWHNLYEHYTLLLKTQCDIHHTALEHKCDGHHIQNP